MHQGQKRLIQFALRYCNEWNSYAPNKPTVELICATVNLGIIKVNKFKQFKLKSQEKARQFLAARA